MFNPWVRKTPWRREWHPTPVFLPGEFNGQKSLMNYCPWGCKESDMTGQLTLSLFHFTVLLTKIQIFFSNFTFHTFKYKLYHNIILIFLMVFRFNSVLCLFALKLNSFNNSLPETSIVERPIEPKLLRRYVCLHLSHSFPCSSFVNSHTCLVVL